MAKRKKPKTLTQTIADAGLGPEVPKTIRQQQRYDRIVAKFQEEAIHIAMQGRYAAYPYDHTSWIVLDPYRCTFEATKKLKGCSRYLPEVQFNPSYPFIHSEMIAKDFAALLNAGRVARLEEEAV